MALWAQFSGAPRSCGLVPVNAHVTCNMDAGLAYQLLRHQRLAPRFPRESHLLRANLMPWSPRGQVTAGRSVCGSSSALQRARKPLLSPQPELSIPPFRSDFYASPPSFVRKWGPGLRPLGHTRHQHLRVSALQPAQAPRGDTSNSRRDQDLRPGRRQQSLPSPTMWQERSAETRHTLRNQAPAFGTWLRAEHTHCTHRHRQLCSRHVSDTQQSVHITHGLVTSR